MAAALVFAIEIAAADQLAALGTERGMEMAAEMAAQAQVASVPAEEMLERELVPPAAAQ